jgi:hypothetical protein
VDLQSHPEKTLILNVKNCQILLSESYSLNSWNTTSKMKILIFHETGSSYSKQI